MTKDRDESRDPPADKDGAKPGTPVQPRADSKVSEADTSGATWHRFFTPGFSVRFPTERISSANAIDGSSTSSEVSITGLGTFKIAGRLEKGAADRINALLDQKAAKVKNARNRSVIKLGEHQGISFEGENSYHRVYLIRDRVVTLSAQANQEQAVKFLDSFRLEPAPAKPVAPGLWERLGGEKGVSEVANEAIDRFAKAFLKFQRQPEVDFGPEKRSAFKKGLVAYLSQSMGGPVKYTGKNMKDAHKGMAISILRVRRPD